MTLKHEVDRVERFDSNTEVARSELTLRAGEWLKSQCEVSANLQ